MMLMITWFMVGEAGCDTDLALVAMSDKIRHPPCHTRPLCDQIYAVKHLDVGAERLQVLKTVKVKHRPVK